MKAVRIHEYGGPEVLKIEDVETPTPAADDLLIKVYATSVNPVDSKIRSGKNHQRYNNPMPLTLGWDVSGTIEEIGADVKGFKRGDEVYARPDLNRDGTYAEYVVVKASKVGFKPKSLTHNEAAAVPLAALTAWQGIFDHGRLQAGQRILIHGASGGVGTFAVQLAKWKGAYVIGTASESNIDFLKGLGADEVIDYKNQKFEEILKDIDVVFDLIGGDTQKKSVQVLKEGGILVSTLGIVDKDLLAQKNIHGEAYMAQSIPDQLNQMATLIDEGKLKPVIAKVMPLEEAAEAERESEAGHVRGKIVLEVRK